jgi:methyl-accepting chemotaxis protein
MIQDIKTTANALEQSAKLFAKNNPTGYKDKDFKQSIYNTKIGQSGYVYMINEQGTMVVHHKKEGKNYAGKSYVDYIRSHKEGGVHEYVSATTGQHKIVAFRYIPEWKLWIIPGINKAEYYDKMQSKFIKFFTIMMIFLVSFLLGVGYSIFKTTMTSINGLEKGLNDFFEFISHKTSESKKLIIHHNDEIGKMAKAININIEKTKDGFIQDKIVLKEVNEITSKIQKGLFTHRVTQNANNPALNTLKQDLNKMLDSMQSKIGNDLGNLVKLLEVFMKSDFSQRLDSPHGDLEKVINKLGSDISAMLEKNNTNANILKEKSDKLNESVDEVAEIGKIQDIHLNDILQSVQELNTIILSNSKKSKSMGVLTNEVKELSNNGSQLAKDTSSSMNEINQATSMITESVSAIESIAFQTNILSLNAAVEAATAGEAGKGFAVVAGEVRNLASKSAEAAQNIRTSVEEAQNKSQFGQEISNKMIQEYSILIDKINLTINSINDLTSTRSEQNEKIKEINHSIEELKNSNDKNLGISNDTKNITDELANISTDILQDISNKKF